MRVPTGPRARAPAAAPNDRLLTSVGWGVAFVRGQLGTQLWDESAMDAVPFAPDAEPVNILCMDGGGIRGRNQVVIIEELEAALGWPVAEQFDLVAGTSIGGCGASRVLASSATSPAQQMSSHVRSCSQRGMHSSGAARSSWQSTAIAPRRSRAR